MYLVTVQAGASSIFRIIDPALFALVLVDHPVVLLDLVIVGKPSAAYHAGIQPFLIAIQHQPDIRTGLRLQCS
jgi:hypothetical protein